MYICMRVYIGVGGMKVWVILSKNKYIIGGYVYIFSNIYPLYRVG